MISSRVKVLKTCLELLYKNYNNKFQFPVHIFHFDDIYSNDYIEDIQNSINKNINFHQIEYKIPDNIEEKDLYYNKTFLKYVRLNFSKKRIGYLHANYFWNNFFKIPILQQYDYTMRIDDDSFFINEINENLFETLYNKKIKFGTGFTNNADRYAHDVRYKLFDFVKEFCKDNNIIPKNKNLYNGIKNNDEKCIIGIKGKTNLLWNCGNCNVYDMSMFKEEQWIKWNKKFNDEAGGYKYRWGDIEMIGLYTYLLHDLPIHDFKLKEKGLYETGNTKWLRVGTAPSTKN